jgi:hypothetical protein
LEDTVTNVLLINFWAGMKEEFPHISSADVKKILLPDDGNSNYF